MNFSQTCGEKEPIIPAMSGEIVKDAQQSNALSDLRLATACLLAFEGFLHFNKLINIKPCDITCQEELTVIHLPQSKTDQLQKGDEVAITRTGNLTCPMAMLKACMATCGIAWSDRRFLFGPISKSGNAEKLKDSGSINYKTFSRS